MFITGGQLLPGRDRAADGAAPGHRPGGGDRGVADERMGEVGCAWIVRRPGTELDEPGCIAWCRGQMANYKVPRFVRFVDALPVNASAKVDKKLLRQAWAAPGRYRLNLVALRPARRAAPG